MSDEHRPRARQILRARLLDDERAAEPVAEDGTRWLYDGIDATGQGWVLATSGSRIECPLPVARHIARQQPARVLREIEAKRRIVATYELWRDFGGTDKEAAFAKGLGDSLRILASAYSDHPDYLQEWAQ